MRSHFYNRIFIAAIFLFFIGISAYSLDVSGDITENTQWTISDSPVIVTGTVTVLNGVTLTIDPGVSVRFTPGTSLIVQGALVAEGTELDPILFTSNSATPAPGDWRAIVFENTSNAGSVFTFCIVEYGGSGDTAGNIYYRTGAFSVPLSNSTFRHSSAHGLNLRASSPVLSNLTVENNAQYGIFSDTFSNFNIQSSTIANNTQGGVRIPVNSQPTIANTTIENNGIGIFLDNDAAPTITDNLIENNTVGIQVSQIGSSHPVIRDNDIQGNANWGILNNSSSTLTARRNYWGSDSGPYHPTINPTGQGDTVSDRVEFNPWNIKDNDYPVTIVNQNIVVDTVWDEGIYWVQSNVNLSSGVLLTINPGVIVKFASGVRLQIDGTLLANGTEANMIVFTSDRDDSYGGDTNGDGDATSPAPGNWSRLYFRSGSGNSQMSYCIVKFGGSGNVGQIHVENSNPAFSNLFISNGSRDGMYFWGNTSTTADNVHVSNNNRYGINVDNNYSLAVLNSTVIGNSDHGIFATSATISSVQNSNILNNSGHGVYNVSTSAVQTFLGNTVENNNGTGIVVNNETNLILFEDNILRGNSQEGILSSRAQFINNTFENNRYPIGVWGRLGNIYEDGDGADNNTFVGNTFNNAIALRSGTGSTPPRDTLTTVFPEAITSGVYVAIDNISVSSGTELVIEPGVIVKMDSGRSFSVGGKIHAEGTSEEPIVFTSYRDASYGGKTNHPDDDTEPAPGNWQRLQIGSGASTSSVLRHVIVQYGGASSTQNVFFHTTSLTTPVEIESRYSSREGIWIWRSIVTMENSVIEDNNREGIVVDGNDAELILRNSAVMNNGMQGIATTNSNAGLREVSNNTVTGNGSSGIWVRDANIPQTFVGNTISENGTFGIHQNNMTSSALEVQYIGNIVKDNGSDGIATSRARFIDNTITGNRYPIAVFGRLGNIYVDADGNDGNIISGNTFNDAIAMISVSGASPRDTLTTVFPEAITSGVYVAIDNISVSSGTELVIEPGVIVKMDSGRSFSVGGKIHAEGTSEEPIVFTSYRDASYGGKTNHPDDDTEPAPGNWQRLQIGSGASTSSVLRHVIVQYGGASSTQNVFFHTTSLTTPVEIESRYSSREGIWIWRSIVTMENSVIEDNNREGIVVDGNDAELILRNSAVMNNGMQGIATTNSNAGLREVSNNTVSGNGSSGIWVRDANIPQTFIGNTIEENGTYGLYILTNNNSIDTLQVITGNHILNNNETGMVFTRSYVTDNTISGNKYPLGLIGQMSLESTGNENGSFFEGNIIENNTFDNAITLLDNIHGVLGGSYPDAMDKPVYAVIGTGNIDVPSGRTLDIKPGTVVKFPDGGGIRVNGVILSRGTVNNKIVFTSWKDDTYGGDTNADSTNTVPGSGDWRGLELWTEQSDDSHILNTILRYGGRSSQGNLYIRNNSAPVDSVFVSYSSNNGIYIFNGSPVITAAEIHNNPTGIRIEGNSSSPVVRLSNIRDNSNFGLDNRQNNTVDAVNNYWGAESGPFVNQGSDQNLTGEGNRIGINPGAVLYRPFLPTRSGILLGDVSENGLISAYDASLILRYLVDKVELSPTQLAAADVSADGTVSAFDASLIMQYVVGVISGFPGLGKVAGPIFVANGVEFYIEEGTAQNKAVLIMRLTEPGHVFASQINFNFDNELIHDVTVEKTELSRNMLLEYNTIENATKIAMAGANPVTEEGDLLKIVFELNDDVPNTGLLAIEFDLLKINENDITSSVTSATIREPIVGLPIEYGLDQNYPNPFNPATTIRYQIPESAMVTIKVYDMLGREITTLVNEEHDPGYYSIEWNSRDAAGLPVASGVYLYRIQVESAGTSTYSSVKRMTLIK